MTTIRIIIAIFFMGFASTLQSQYMVEMFSKWDNDLSEWIIVLDNEEEIILEQSWAFRGDWTEWSYTYNEEWAVIKQKWKDNPNLWELRVGGETYNMRTLWRDDFDEWRIEGEGSSFTMESRYSNIRDEWLTRGERKGTFDMITAREGDPRDWIIEDYLDEDTSIHMRVALAFVVMFNSIPKY